MASFRLLMFFIATASMGWLAVAEEASAQSGPVDPIREKRHLHKKKLCRKYGICEGVGGVQGGYFQGGFQGYQGYQGGYGQPPINIAISQSQSSANEAGGGYGSGHYPHNYQYNGGYGQGYAGYGGHGGPGGFGGAIGGPGHFGNGQGAYNNQFNGNYYGPQGPNVGGGYGFQKPGFGPFYDENPDEEDGHGPQQSDPEGDDVPHGPGGYNDYNQHGQGYNQGHHSQGYAVAAFAVAGRSKN